MSVKTLYIHIGCEKTGTTTIQNSLAKNRTELRNQGFLYPEFGKNPVGHFSLPASLHYLDHPKSSVPGYYDIHDVEPEVEWQNFITLCQQNQDANIIVSAEHFSSRVGPNGIAFIKDKLAALTPYFDIKFILFLRRQDLFLESSYSTTVKSGGTTPFDRYVELNCHFDKRYNFKHLIHKWLTHFDKTQFIVKEYADSVKGKGLLETLYEITGIDGSRLQPPAESHNESWSQSMIDFALLCNSPRISRILKRKRLGFLEKVASLPQFRDDKSKYKLLPQQRADILNYFKSSNVEIENAFFDGRPLLSDYEVEYSEPAEMEHAAPIQRFTKMDILAMFAAYATQDTKD